MIKTALAVSNKKKTIKKQLLTRIQTLELVILRYRVLQ